MATSGPLLHVHSQGFLGSGLSALFITGDYVQSVSYLQKGDGNGTFDYLVDFGDGASPGSVPSPLQNATFTLSLDGYELSIANFADTT